MVDPAPTILHAALPDDWAAACEAGVYTMSTRGRTLAEEGFIHCSRPDQVEAVANHFFADIERLVLLTIDTHLLDVPVRDESPFPGSDERYPHIYGRLPVGAVVDTTDWLRSASGWSLDGR